MTTLECPHCGHAIEVERTWAQVAVATLAAGPAMPDMATQVRCGHCGRVSAASDLRSRGAGATSRARWLVWLVGLALLAWAVAVLARG